MRTAAHYHHLGKEPFNHSVYYWTWLKLAFYEGSIQHYISLLCFHQYHNIIYNIKEINKKNSICQSFSSAVLRNFPLHKNIQGSIPTSGEGLEWLKCVGTRKKKLAIMIFSLPVLVIVFNQ